MGAAPALVTPGAKLLAGLGLRPGAGRQARPGGAARRGLRERTLSTLCRLRACINVDRVDDKRRRRAPASSGVWHELQGRARDPARAPTLTVAPGERVALMGRNGAGKSTLLRHAAGLMEPTRGTVDAAGRVALLLQNPGDYLVHDTVAEEASPEAPCALVGLAHAVRAPPARPQRR